MSNASSTTTVRKSSSRANITADSIRPRNILQTTDPEPAAASSSSTSTSASPSSLHRPTQDSDPANISSIDRIPRDRTNLLDEDPRSTSPPLMATSENTDLDSARQASAHHQVTPLGFAPAPILNHRVSVDRGDIQGESDGESEHPQIRQRDNSPQAPLAGTIERRQGSSPRPSLNGGGGGGSSPHSGAGDDNAADPAPLDQRPERVRGRHGHRGGGGGGGGDGGGDDDDPDDRDSHSSSPTSRSPSPSLQSEYSRLSAGFHREQDLFHRAERVVQDVLGRTRATERSNPPVRPRPAGYA